MEPEEAQRSPALGHVIVRQVRERLVVVLVGDRLGRVHELDPGRQQPARQVPVLVSVLDEPVVEATDRHERGALDGERAHVHVPDIDRVSGSAELGEMPSEPARHEASREGCPREGRERAPPR